MTNLRSILLGSAAAMTLAAAPAWSQATAPAETVTEEIGQTGANAVAEGAEAVEGVTPPEIAEGRWAQTYGETYGEFGDRNVEELVGTDVVSAEGNNIGEVDNFVLVDDQIAAVVGIGGFLGIGEHNVALALNELTWNGEQLVIEGYTEDQLRELPAYDEAGGTVIGAGTLREGYNTAGGEPIQAEPATEGAATDVAAAQPEGELQAEEVQSAEAGAATEGSTDLTEQAGAETAEAETTEPVEGSTETAAGTTAPEAGSTNLTEQAGGSGTVPLEGAEAEADTAAAEGTEQSAAEPTEMAADATTPPAEGTAETAMTTEAPAEGSAEMAATETPAEEPADTAATTTEAPAEGASEMAATETPTEEPADTAAMTAEEPAEGEAEMAATETPTEEPVDTAAATTEAPAEGAAETAATEMPVEGAAEGETEMAAEGDRWTDDMNNVFGDIADRQVAELIGTDVAGSDGEVIGQVDNFALMGDQVVAVVGVGGFLGLGKHNVGLPLDQLTWDGERLVLSGMTEEDLRNMPAYDEAGGAFIEGENTLRGTYNQM